MSQDANAQNAQGFIMTAPVQASTKRDDVKLLPQGPNPCILYSIVDLGTHHSKFYKKDRRLVRLTFEFPLFKQLFRTTDTEPKPTVHSVTENYFMSEGSNLKKWCDQMSNKYLVKAEYENGYNIAQFLNKVFVAMINCEPGRKDPNVIYNTIDSVAVVNEHTRAAYNFDWDAVVRTNDIVAFGIDPQGKCFQSETFAKLPGFLRDKIMESHEALKYKAEGGEFIEKAEYEDNQKLSKTPANVPAPQQREVAAGPPKPSSLPIVNNQQLEMLVSDFSYEEYLKSGWTAESLVQNKKAVWLPIPTKPDAPAPSAPAPAPAPAPTSAPPPNDDADDEVPF